MKYAAVLLCGWCARAANVSLLSTLPIDVDAVPPLVVAGVDKGGTSEAFSHLIEYGNFRSRNAYACDKNPDASVMMVGKCRSRSKELACLYRGGNAESWRRCYEGYAPRTKGAPWIDATPNYLWGWLPALDVASRLRELSPTSGVVLLLREPTARLVSLFNYWLLQPISQELGPTLEVHAATDLAYLAAVAAGDVTAVTARSRGRVVDRTTLSLDGLRGGRGQEMFSLLMRNYGNWLDPLSGACAAVLGEKQRSKRSPWLDYTRCVGDGKETCSRSPPPCPVFTNLVLTGAYAPVVRRWLDRFPGRIAVVESEAYFKDPAVLLDLFDGAASPPPVAPARIVNRGAAIGPNATLAAATRASLEALYRPLNADLREMLGAARSAGAAAVVPHPGTWWL